MNGEDGCQLAGFSLELERGHLLNPVQASKPDLDELGLGFFGFPELRRLLQLDHSS